MVLEHFTAFLSLNNQIFEFELFGFTCWFLNKFKVSFSFLNQSAFEFEFGFGFLSCVQLHDVPSSASFECVGSVHRAGEKVDALMRALEISDSVVEGVLLCVE